MNKLDKVEQAKYKCSGCGSAGTILVPKSKSKEVDSKGRLCLTMCLKCEPEIMFKKGYLSYIPPNKHVESKRKGDVKMDKNKHLRETTRKLLGNNPLLDVLEPPEFGMEAIGGYNHIDKYELKRIHGQYDLDKELPKDLEEMFYALRHCNVKYNGETVYNPIATYIEHPDTELVTSELHKITLFSGHNLVNTAVLVLYEIVHRFGCWFVINRTNSDKVEIDIWRGN